MADLCKHHELILQYAEDAQKYAEPWKLWETQQYSGRWSSLDGHPNWFSGVQYRRKPRTIRIGEYDVPEPIRVEPETRQKVYLADPTSFCFYCGTTYEPNCTGDARAFRRGLLHATLEAAELHGRALASLTSDA